MRNRWVSASKSRFPRSAGTHKKENAPSHECSIQDQFRGCLTALSSRVAILSILSSEPNFVMTNKETKQNMRWRESKRGNAKTGRVFWSTNPR
jgi:hypothetical protein